MKARAYLTIDDSPSMRMDDLVDYLSNNAIPALFFCRGDYLERNAMSAIRAVQSGFHLGNHSFSHARASQTSVEDFIEEIEKTEKLIEQMYIMGGYNQDAKYFRFPHLDRGCGSNILDYSALELKERNIVRTVFSEGLNHISGEGPTDEDLKKKADIQAYLKSKGYVDPCSKVNVPWYKNNTEIQNAADCLFTFSTADWMLTQRHQGKWIYKTREDLKSKIDRDQWLLKDNMVGTVLLHDQAEIIDDSIALVEHMLQRGIEFLEFDT